MTLTASRTTDGFELVGNMMNVSDNGVEYELTPNTAFSRGDMVVLTAGKVAKAAANATNVLGVMAESFTTATNPSGKTTKGKVYDNPFNIYKCSFADHLDSTATGGTTTTLVDTALTTSTDDDWNGALLYIYEGAAAGSLRTVKDYTGSSDTLTVEEPFPVAPDTTSKYILLGLGGAANADVINIGKAGVDLKDENTIDANATVASEAGPLVVMPTSLDDIKDLILRVMIQNNGKALLTGAFSHFKGGNQMIISDNWGELLLPGLRKIYDKHQKMHKDYLAEIFNVENSSKAQEFNLGLGELGVMDEWQSSGAKVSYEDFSKGFKSTYTHKKYSKGVQLERELVEDDQYSEIKKRVKKLARVVYFTTQKHAASVFNNAFNASYYGPDGKALCASDHPKMPGSASTFSNVGTLELTAENVETTRTNMLAWTDDKGNELLIMPDTLIVPPALRKKAIIIAETKEEPDITDHAINIWVGNLAVVEYPFLTDSNAWFLCDKARMKENLNWFWRRKPDFADKVEFDDEVA